MLLSGADVIVAGPSVTLAVRRVKRRKHAPERRVIAAFAKVQVLQSQVRGLPGFTPAQRGRNANSRSGKRREPVRFGGERIEPGAVICLCEYSALASLE